MAGKVAVGTQTKDGVQLAHSATSGIGFAKLADVLGVVRAKAFRDNRSRANLEPRPRFFHLIRQAQRRNHGRNPARREPNHRRNTERKFPAASIHSKLVCRRSQHVECARGKKVRKIGEKIVSQIRAPRSK